MVCNINILVALIGQLFKLDQPTFQI